jgi:hypothetical protein
MAGGLFCTVESSLRLADTITVGARLERVVKARSTTGPRL